MAEKDSLTEESKWLVELLWLLWITLLAIGGGTMGLILGEHSSLRNTFAVFGAIAIVILAAVLYRIRTRAIEIIRALEEK